MSQFLSEVHAQPDSLRALVEHYRGEGAEALEAARTLCAARQPPLLFTGMGSSFYPPLSVRARLVAAGLRPELREAGELLHYEMAATPAGAILMAISQSGESAETRQVAEALAATCRVVAVTNDPDNALARYADVVLPLCAGDETAISTKTYTNTLALLHLLATSVAREGLEPELERLEGMAAPMECTFAQRADDLAAAHDSLTVALPEVGEDLFSLAACVPLELLLHNMAQDRGVEAGVFERISKVTRRE